TEGTGKEIRKEIEKLGFVWENVSEKILRGRGYEDLADRYGRWASENLKEGTEKAYITPHWDEPNVFSHARVNDRTTPEGEKVLFIEEIQSDWAREAREKGVKSEDRKEELQKAEKDLEAFQKKITEKYGSGNWYARKATQEERNKYDNLLATLRKYEDKGVPDFPFRKNWTEFTLKNILKRAVAEGYDRISWVTGEQTANRYDLSKQVDAVYAAKYEDGTYTLDALKGGNMVSIAAEVKENDLEKYVGKTLAQKIIDEKIEAGEDAEFAGKNLKIGGEWAVNLYDKQIPSFLKKYAKKWGAKVEEMEMDRGERTPYKSKTIKQLSLPITPAMRESIPAGQPMFAKQLEEREIDGVPVKSFKGPEKEAAIAYEAAKDAWIGEKDVRVLKAQVEKRKLQKRIK
ncbi:unnamed protein product, partial [marine sediment metagenome]